MIDTTEPPGATQTPDLAPWSATFMLAFIMLSTGNSVTNIYHQDRPENALIIFTFHPDGGQRAIIAFIYREGNYYVFLFTTEILKTKCGLPATYIVYYYYYCTVMS